MQGIVNNDKSVKAWGVSILKTLNPLVGGPKPLQWTLVIPDAETQSRLASEYLGAVSAMGRFRYADVELSLGKRSERFPTVAGQGKELTPVKADASIGDIKFNFYTHSNTATPDATFVVKGLWAPISLYLRDESVKNDEKDIRYVPITVQDGMGVEYVFFIGLKFGKQLPEPEYWPSSYNWPEFSYESPSTFARRQHLTRGFADIL